MSESRLSPSRAAEMLRRQAEAAGIEGRTLQIRARSLRASFLIASADALDERSRRAFNRAERLCDEADAAEVGA